MIGCCICYKMQARVGRGSEKAVVGVQGMKTVEQNRRLKIGVNCKIVAYRAGHVSLVCVCFLILFRRFLPGGDTSVGVVWGEKSVCVNFACHTAVLLFGSFSVRR